MKLQDYYRPINWLAEKSPTFRNFMTWYLNIWTPLFPPIVTSAGIPLDRPIGIATGEIKAMTKS
jgi:hypothetical protein